MVNWKRMGQQVYVNGHSWLARQMTHWGLGFVQHGNASWNWTIRSGLKN